MSDVLKVSPDSRVLTTKNGTRVHDFQYRPISAAYTQMTDGVLIITTASTSSVVGLGSIAIGRNVLIGSDQKVTLIVTDAGVKQNITLRAGGACSIYSGSVTAIKAKSSTTVPVNVEYCVTD